MYDYSKLCGKITEIFKTQANFAREMGLSENSVSAKLNNKIDFKQSEISRAAHLLGISEQEYSIYFFAIDVQNK